MKTLLALALSVFALSAFAADNLYTRIDYPAPRVKQASDSRIFPAMVMYQTDGNSNVSPIGPIVSGSWAYATPVATAVTNNTAVVLKAANASNVNYTTSLSIFNSSATPTVASIKDGSTVIWSGYVPATTGQVTLRFDPPLKGTISTATNFVVESSGVHVYVSAQGFVR